jgi:hypothetical protein
MLPADPTGTPTMPETSEALPFLKSFAVEFEDVPADFLRTVSRILKDGVKGRSLSSIEIALPVRTDDCVGYIDALPRIAARSRAAAAAALLDKSSFSTTKDYDETVRILSCHIGPVAVRIEGDVGLVRYAVDGTYRGFAGGPFGDWAMAHDKEEAEFLIRWTMTENHDFNFADDPAMFGRVMAQHRIHKTNVRPEPYPEREIKTALADLVREAQAGGNCGPALDLARTIAEASGFDVEPVPVPGIAPS